VRHGSSLEFDRVPVDEELPGMLEIDGDAVTDSGLDLAQSPIGTLRMADEIARREMEVSGSFDHASASIFREAWLAERWPWCENVPAACALESASISREHQMSNTRLAIASALAAALVLPLAAQAQGNLEKCFGVVKAGKNDCQTATSSCAGTSKKDAQSDAWISVPKGTCDKIVGGKTSAG
jgi:uncharacterized membrane protein